MAFWIDPLALLGLGAIIAWVSKHHFGGSDLAIYGFELLVMVVTYAVAIGLFLNVSVFRPLWTALGAETGTAFMINGGVLRLVDAGTVWTDLGPGAMALSILLFALYPFFLRLGVMLGRVLVGRHPDQSGLLGLLQPN